MLPQVGVSSPSTPGQSGSVMVNADGTRISGNEKVYRTIILDGGIKSGALAAKSVGHTILAGSNNDLDFAGKANGLAGNDVIIEYLNPNAAAQSLLVSVAGSRITVSLATAALIAASRVLTSTNTELADGATVTIDSIVYRFKDTPSQAYDIFRDGSTADTTMGRLIKAINATGVAGTDYFTGTLIHPTVSAGALTAHAFTATAKTAGTAGNAIVIGETSSVLSWAGGATSLSGGLDAGQITSLASDISTAIAANTDANALIDVTNHSGNDGSGVVTAMVAMQLSGGSDGTIPLFTVKGACLVSLRAYCETTLAGATGTLVHGKTGTTNDLVASLVGTTVVAGDGIDSTGRVARGTALAATPLKTYFDGQTIFATVGTAPLTGGKLHYIVDYIPETAGAHLETT